MESILNNQNVLNDPFNEPLFSAVKGGYIDFRDMRVRLIYESDCGSDTSSVRASESEDTEASPYELMRNSGALSFLDDQEEDLYSFEDGEAL